VFSHYRAPMMLLRYDYSVESEEVYLIECPLVLRARSEVFVASFWGLAQGARREIEVGVILALFWRVSSGSIVLGVD